jgi:4,5-dihydroxyphthalate decarboxylase
MATTPRLKVALGTYGHTAALKDGRVKIAGVEPDFVEVVPIIGAFRRMVRDLEFDVCEMAPTTYMIARALGAPFIALPVFLMRRFHHGGFVYRPDSGIRTPKDLERRSACAPIRSPPACGRAASSSTNTDSTRPRSPGWSTTRST